MHYNTIDIRDQRFGRLRVVKPVGTSRDRKVTWLCICDCGNECIAIGRKLRSGRTKSCGCLRHEAVSLGIGSASRFYKILKGMHDRCYNSKCKDFKYYGGRGITICEQWHHIEMFRGWALSNGYAENLTIDRVDNDGNYTPENCEWVTVAENLRRRHRGARCANQRLLELGENQCPQ